MKRIFTIIATLLALILVACEKETVLTIDQTSLSFTDTGGSQTISLTANKPWSVKCDQSWCKVSPSSGEEAASSKISISCDANTTYDARNCTVTFTCAELTKAISVTQATNNGLLVSQTSYELTKAAQQLNIQVQANVKFSVEVDAGCKDWITYKTTKGLTTNTVVLDIAENNSYDSREGKVTIKQDGGNLSSTVVIKQGQTNGLFLTTSEYNLSNENHTLTVEVKSNIDFEVKSEADWIKYVETKGLKTNQIILDVSANDGYDKREGTVVVKQKNGDLSGTIKIKQDEKYGILVTQSEYNLSNEAQTIDVEVKYNVDFDVVIPDECKDWVSIVGTKALDTKTCTFAIKKNETYSNRECTVTIKQKGGEMSNSFTIKQSQTDILDVSPTEFTVDVEGGDIDVEVKSNIGYDIAIEESATAWITIVDTKAPTEDKVSFNIASCADNIERTGKITISKKNYSFTITVQQYSYAANTIIKFADEKVKAKLVEAFDTNKDGELSIREARAVKSIAGVFGTIKTYSSFDEFQYFSGVTEIPASMFEGWVLKSIQLPPNIMYIMDYAFKGCALLPEVNIPQSVVYLGYGVFMDCPNLVRMTIPQGVSRIMMRLFQGCTNLKSVALPESLREIQASAFEKCTALTNIDLPLSLEELGARAFLGCTNLTTIVIPNGIKQLNNGTFFGCSNLSSVTIPDSVTTIKDAQYDSKINSYLGCFMRCKNLRTIQLPKRLRQLGSWTFNSSGLVSITLPDSISAIDYRVFENCDELTSVIIPESVSEIRDCAFWGCTKLANINIPESVTVIGSSFLGCESLVSMIIPDSVVKIGSSAFSGCSNLESVEISKNLSEIGASLFTDCIKLKSITIPENVVKIYSRAFLNCSSITSLVFPKNVTYIGELVASSCYSLQSITVLPAQVPILENINALEGTYPIYIPSESVDAYKTAPGWSEYANRLQAIP